MLMHVAASVAIEMVNSIRTWIHLFPGQVCLFLIGTSTAFLCPLPLAQPLSPTSFAYYLSSPNLWGQR